MRYKQTAIGILWALLRPLLTTGIFTFVFSRVAKLPSEGDAPYALMVMAGLLPWMLFSSALSDASGSIVNNANLISKVYFPRIIVPVSAVVVALFDAMISFAIIIVLMLVFEYPPTWHLLLAPLFLLPPLAISVGVGVYVSALNVKYRDFKHVIPFLLQLGLYISPVGFNSGIIPDYARMLYSLNPMVGAIEGFRWCLLHGTTSVYLPAIGISFLWALALPALGMWQFRRLERAFADEI